MVVGLSILFSLMLSLGSTVDKQHAGHSLSMSKGPLQYSESHGVAKLIATNSANFTFNHGKCLLCKVLVRHGMQRVKTTKNVATLLNIVEKMCVLLRLESSQVCKGGIDIFGKQVSAVLKQVDFSPEDLCYLAFPDQCSVSAMSLLASRKWKIPLPTARMSPAETCRHEHQQHPKSENALKVLHLTDIHVDLLYNLSGKTVKAGAYYTVLVLPGLRVVSLNTNFCYTENWWIYLSSEDPAGMLMWFVKVLTEAENAGEKVHVIGHVPPGRSPDCLESWSENYYRIIERFKCTITGQFFGHTHFDEMQLFYENEKPIAVAYIAPSATPYVDMNSSFRVYDIHGLGLNPSWSVMNHYTYFLDLEEANQSGVAKWKLEYDALGAYNLSSLAPKDWAELISNWKAYLEDPSDNPPLNLVRYMTFYSRGRFDPRWKEGT